MKYLLLALVSIYATTAVIEGCKKNSDCASGFCDGGTFWKSGTCRSLVADGGRCLQNGDANSCISKKCICSHCGQRMSDGYQCSANSDCRSGWCNGVFTIGCRGVCKSKTPDGQKCQGASDGNSCASGKCICRYCGRKLRDSFPCSENADCQSGWCNGVVTIGCQGRCKSKTPDGQRCQGASDGNSCISGKCICGYCGRKLRDTLPCSENADCQSGWCNGVVTVGCNGKCKSKTADYGSCPLNIHGSGDNNNCKSGRCEKVSASKALCAPKNGFRVGTACNEDTDCDKTKSLWCKGGSFYSSGVCTQCPSKCPDGCNALFNSMGNMKCGRMTTFDHAVDFAKKIAKPIVDFIDCLTPKAVACGKDALKGFASCLDPTTPCVVKLGGKGSACLAFTNPGLSYNYKNGPFSLHGSVKPIGGMSIEADVTDGKIKLQLYGRVSVKAEAAFEASLSTKYKYKKKLYLSHCIGKKCSICKTPTSKAMCRPMVLFAKAFVLGVVPVILELKIQAVAEVSIEIDAAGSFKAGLSYENDAVVSIEKAIATFDPVKGVKLDVGFANNFNKQIQKTFSVQAGVGIKGVIRIGAEITAAVNGIPISILPAARLVAEGKVETTNSGCLTGSFSAGIGLDAGITLGFSVPNPAPLMGAVCRALVETTCNIPHVKIANCAVKVAFKADPCKEAGGLCGQLEGEIAKLVPENLGKAFSGAATIIQAKFTPFNFSGKSYCVGGQKPFLSETSDVMAGKLQGGGGGSGIKTCGAPGVSTKCQEVGGGVAQHQYNYFAFLLAPVLAHLAL